MACRLAGWVGTKVGGRLGGCQVFLEQRMIDKPIHQAYWLASEADWTSEWTAAPFGRRPSAPSAACRPYARTDSDRLVRSSIITTSKVDKFAAPFLDFFGGPDSPRFSRAPVRFPGHSLTSSPSAGFDGRLSLSIYASEKSG